MTRGEGGPGPLLGSRAVPWAVGGRRGSSQPPDGPAGTCGQLRVYAHAPFTQNRSPKRRVSLAGLSDPAPHLSHRAQMMLGACAHPGHLRLPDGGASSSEMPAVASLVPPSPEAPQQGEALSGDPRHSGALVHVRDTGARPPATGLSDSRTVKFLVATKIRGRRGRTEAAQRGGRQPFCPAARGDAN